MSMIEDIRKDREAGTQGPWDWEGGDGPENIHAKANLGVWSESLLQDALDDDSYDEPDDEKWVCGIWGEIDNRQCTDARRIARVPMLEAALLAAEELAEAVMQWGHNEIGTDKVLEHVAAYRAATEGKA